MRACICVYIYVSTYARSSPPLFLAVLGIEPRGVLPLGYTPSPIFLFFFFFSVPGIEPRGILPPSYTPSPIFYPLF